ncbi:MAG TPA: hypothetical protein VFU46_06655 [Gemmatimonadales bacterium]|nr:hypothetical protein [Gemmatimonadales bacterium]
MGRTLAWLALSVSSACTAPASPPALAPGPEARAERFGGVSLVLNNRYWLDVVVKIEHDGETSRIGQVAAASSRHFVLPAWMLGASGYVRFVADPVGSPERGSTDWVNVWGGQTVEWTLESQLERSSMLVY